MPTRSLSETVTAEDTTEKTFRPPYAGKAAELFETVARLLDVRDR